MSVEEDATDIYRLMCVCYCLVAGGFNWSPQSQHRPHDAPFTRARALWEWILTHAHVVTRALVCVCVCVCV